MFQLEYVPTPTFEKVHADPNKFIFVRGPVGSGKTSGIVWDSLFNAMQQHADPWGVRKAKYAVLRASYPALKSTTVKTFQDWLKNLITVVYDVPIRGSVTMPHPDGQTRMEIEYVFVALDRPEEVNKLQSLELTSAYLNEAAEMPQEVFQMLKTRIDRFPPRREGLPPVKPRILCEYNAPDTDHWIYKLAEEVRPPKHSFYEQPPALLVADHETLIRDADGNYYELNPEADNIKALNEEYYADMVLGADYNWVKVFVLNQYGMVRTGRPVYEEYNDAIHCSEKTLEPIKGFPLIIGMDLGLTPAAAICQQPIAAPMQVIDEIVTENCSIDVFCSDYLKPLLTNKYHGFNYMIFIDPSAVVRSQNDAKAAYEVIQKHFPREAVQFGRTNNKIARKESVVYFLRKQSGFLLSPECKVLRKGFISHFHYEKINTLRSLTDRYKEQWEKNIYSHVHEALQYACLEMSEGQTMRRAQALRRKSPTHKPFYGDVKAGY